METAVEEREEISKISVYESFSMDGFSTNLKGEHYLLCIGTVVLYIFLKHIHIFVNK